MSPAACFPLKGRKLWVAGHHGMVGSAILRRLAGEECEILTASHADLDLTRQVDVENWLGRTKPDAIFLAAARVGGILANDTRPADFIYDNLAIEMNVLNAAFKTGVKKLLFLGSSCIYPKLAPQPMPEEALLEGQLEPTNQWYAIAKIAGLKMGQAYRRQYGADFISAMPTNLYGPGDNFDLLSSHVIPALIAKMHRAKVEAAASVEIWGTGKPRREFLFVDDLADALVHLMKVYSDELHINVGTGVEIAISDLAALVAKTVGFSGDIFYDTGKPDGAPRKLLDVRRLNALGWQAKMSLEEGLRKTYQSYLKETESASAAAG
ncbi:GDP-L-fucose synthase [Rhodospirillaceae bacterium AH-315-P19]|nr:GDP-L-fucose synthase [Rhodospirillaceae bacterium AH-315-P19]